MTTWKAREKQKLLIDFGNCTNVPIGNEWNIECISIHGLPKGSTLSLTPLSLSGTKEAKAVKGEATNVIFKTYCRGVVTNRDAWVYNFNRNTLTENVRRMIDLYNAEVDRWKRRENQRINVNDFVVYDDTKN